MKFKLSLLTVITLLGLTACQIIGLTNDYDKLTEKQRTLIMPFTSFDNVSPGYIYEINANQLKEELMKHPKALVYVFANGCSSKDCLPMFSYENYAKKNGYKLFLVMSGYGNLNKTINQNIDSPLYTVDAEFYNTKYSNNYLRYFENELLNYPRETKWKERKEDGNLFFFQNGNLQSSCHTLPENDILTVN